MPASTKDEVAKRRAQVSELYLSGHFQAAIGEKLRISQQQVSHDLAAIRKDWRASSVRDFDDAKGEELAKIDRLEQEYWSAWALSKQSFKKTVMKGKGGEGGKAAPQPSEVTQIVEERHGDPRYLDGVQKCIAQRVQLLGLAAPTKLQHSGLGPVTLVAEVNGSRSQLFNAPPVPPPPPRPAP